MAENAPSSRHLRIDAAELSGVEMTDDGRRLCLRLRDGAGRQASVSIPVDSVNTVLSAVPRAASELPGGAGQPYTLDGWSIASADHGLVLTLQLPDGASIAFAVLPWQIAAMASLAGLDSTPRSRRLN